MSPQEADGDDAEGEGDRDGQAFGVCQHGRHRQERTAQGDELDHAIVGLVQGAGRRTGFDTILYSAGAGIRRAKVPTSLLPGTCCHPVPSAIAPDGTKSHPDWPSLLPVAGRR